MLKIPQGIFIHVTALWGIFSQHPPAGNDIWCRWVLINKASCFKGRIKAVQKMRVKSVVELLSLDFYIFFYYGPPKKDIFFDQLLWSIFQS